MNAVQCGSGTTALFFPICFHLVSMFALVFVFQSLTILSVFLSVVQYVPYLCCPKKTVSQDG